MSSRFGMFFSPENKFLILLKIHLFPALNTPVREHRENRKSFTP